MTYAPPPARTEISDTYPNPSNAVARAGFGKLWDYVTGLLGSTGNPAAAKAALLMPTDTDFTNRLINGNFPVDQRNQGASVTIVGGASPLAFGPDRWMVRSAGANASAQQVNINNQYRLRFTGAASVTAVAASQRIEAVNCADMAGQAVSLSLKASSSSLTSLTLEIYGANTTNTFGTWASPTVTLLSSQTVTITPSETTVSISTTLGTAAVNYTGIEIRITGGALLAGQTLTLGDVQFQKDPVATAFALRPYGTESALCQRYAKYYSNFQIGAAAAPNITYSNGCITLPVTMRAAPTLSGGAFVVATGSVGSPALGGNTTVDAAQVFNASSNWTISATNTVTFSGLLSAEL